MTFGSLVESCFHVTHGVEDVVDIFFTSSEPLVGLSFTLREAFLLADIKALLVEVTGSFIVVLLLEIDGYFLVPLEALVWLAVAVVLFCVHQIFT